MDKFNRNYLLLIEKQDLTTLKVTRPFTVEFDIHRNSFSSANVCSIRVYNLSPSNRAQIRLDQYDWGNKNREISFFAGYGDKLSLGFKGNISQAWSVREGTNMITQIECFDGGYAYINAVTNDQFPSGTQQGSIINSLVQNLEGSGVSRGAIGNFPGEIARGNSFNGSTTEILRDLTGQAFFIDNGKAHCLNDDECLAGDIPVVNSKTGLLGTPIVETQFITFDMLFEPSLKIGQLIKLESQTADHFNGLHKIISIKHRGTISDAVSGEAITSVGLLPGVFNAVSEGT